MKRFRWILLAGLVSRGPDFDADECMRECMAQIAQPDVCKRQCCDDCGDAED